MTKLMYIGSFFKRPIAACTFRVKKNSLFQTKSVSVHPRISLPLPTDLLVHCMKRWYLSVGKRGVVSSLKYIFSTLATAVTSTFLVMLYSGSRPTARDNNHSMQAMKLLPLSAPHRLTDWFTHLPQSFSAALLFAGPGRELWKSPPCASLLWW